MADSLEKIIQRAVSPAGVRVAGSLTVPPSYGVYALPKGSRATRRFRFGNHPVRMQELGREFGPCKLEHLFRSREDARAVALALSDRQA